jgi:hypothetical protein
MYLLTQSKNSISGLELARQLGVRPDTASLMRHKLMSVMAECDAGMKLEGRVEMDDAVLGGEKTELEGGRRGRGGPNKVPFVVAVETNEEGHPLRLLLKVVATHDGAAIEALAKAHLMPGTRVVCDASQCFHSVKRADCIHERVNATKSAHHSHKLACFRWVNTVLGNLKTAIAGTLKSVARRYVPRYLAEFQYRFNRRFKLAELMPRLAQQATRSTPRPYSTLMLPYVAR